MEMDENKMTKLKTKDLFEMIITIIENSENKEEALEKIKNLPILRPYLDN